MNRMMKNNPMMIIPIIFMVLIIAGWIIPNMMGDRIDSQDGEEWGGRWHHMGTEGFWMFPFFPIIVIAVILYIVFGRDRGRWSGTDSGEPALEILKKRYAKGEITKDEFEEMKKDLLS